jgi:hypothetical protein
MNYKKLIIFLIMAVTLQTALYGQKPHRVGTTAANFLEYGFGAAGAAMGDACVATTNDITAMYWNPAGMAFMEQSEAQMVYQPWIVDINTSFAAAGLVIPSIGTIGLGFISVDSGDGCHHVTAGRRRHSRQTIAISLSARIDRGFSSVSVYRMKST